MVDCLLFFNQEFMHFVNLLLSRIHLVCLNVIFSDDPSVFCAHFTDITISLGNI